MDSILEEFYEDQFTIRPNRFDRSSFMNIRAKSPARLHNKTVGDILEMTDWVNNGNELSEKLMTGLHDNYCKERDGSPVITNQQTYYPRFQPLGKKNNSQCFKKATPSRVPTFASVGQQNFLLLTVLTNSMISLLLIVLVFLIWCTKNNSSDSKSTGDYVRPQKWVTVRH